MSAALELNLLNSDESDSVKPFTACFEAEYEAIISIPIIPELEDVEIHKELGVFFNKFTAEYIPFITPIIFILIISIWF